MSAERVRLTALVRGRVQGVGFRVWTQGVAQALELVGSATNLPDGRVEVIAEGPRTACGQLLAALRGRSAPGRVADVEVTWSADVADPASCRGFRTL